MNSDGQMETNINEGQVVSSLRTINGDRKEITLSSNGYHFPGTYRESSEAEMLEEGSPPHVSWYETTDNPWSPTNKKQTFTFPHSFVAPVQPDKNRGQGDTGPLSQWYKIMDGP